MYKTSLKQNKLYLTTQSVVWVVYYVPVLVSTYAPRQLYISGLQCEPPGIYGQEVGIF